MSASAMGTAGQSDDRPTRLAYYASIDGMRGVALTAILLYHTTTELLPGAFLSVSTFFTLSGFLITSLLLYEYENTGGIDLRRFWQRRLRRLMPCAVVALAAIALLGKVVGDASQLHGLTGDGLAALFYVSNWRFIALGADYADLFSSPSLVQHFWSLSIEEQFYMAYPVLALLLLRWGRRGTPDGRPARHALTVAIGIGILASTGTMAALFDPALPTSRLYYGTDTRAAEILVGALVAIWHAGRAPLQGGARRLASGLGVVGVLGTILYWTTVPLAAPWLWRGGFTLYAAITAAALIGCVQRTGPAHALFSWGPFPWLGRVSYGCYIYHFPVFLAITEGLTGLAPWALFALRVALTLVLAALSYYSLEMPIRTGRMLAGRRMLLAMPLGIALSTVALVLAGLNPPALPVDLQELTEEERLVEQASSSDVRILVVGDSVAFGLGKALARWAERTGHASVFNGARLGCGIARGGRLGSAAERLRGVRCDTWLGAWARDLERFRPTVVVVLTGGWDSVDRQFPGWGEPRGPGDPRFDAWALSEFSQAVRLLGSRGARVVWLRSPCLGARHGQVSMEPERVDALNRLIDELPSRSRVEVLDLHGLVCPGGEFTNVLAGIDPFRPDGAHFSEAGADWVTDWLTSRLLAPETTPPRPSAHP